MKVLVKDGYMVCSPQTLDEVSYCLAHAEQKETTCRVLEAKEIRVVKGKRTHCPIEGCGKMVRVGLGLRTHLGVKHKDITPEQKIAIMGVRTLKRKPYPREAALRGWETRKKNREERIKKLLAEKEKETLPAGVKVMSA